MRWAAGAGGLALVLLGPTAGARELWRRGEASLEFSGSVRELVTVGRATGAAAFEEAVAESLPPSECLSAATILDCPFFALPTLPPATALLARPALVPVAIDRVGGAVGDAVDAAVASLACLRAEGFADCAAFRVVGRRDAWQSLTRLRTRFDLRATQQLSATVVYDHEFLAGILDTFEQELFATGVAEPLLELDDDIHLFGLRGDDDRRRWRHLLHRAFVRFETEHVELVVGRQRIPWGVGRLWNPIDRFNALSPLDVEGDQYPGVDAVDVRWRWSGFTFLEAAWAPGAGARRASYALRLHGVLRDVDYSVVTGVFERAWTFGLDLAGNLGGAAFRVEAVFTDPSREVWPVGDPEPHELASFWQVVVSLDRNFDVGSGLYVLVEHLYNGNALGFGRGRAGALLPFFEATDQAPEALPASPSPAGGPDTARLVALLAPDLPPALAAPAAALLAAPLAEAVAAAVGSDPLGPFVRPASRNLFGGSRVVSLARHQTGLQLSYDLTAALRAEFLALYDWNGRSAAFVPALRYTPLGSLEITLGAQLFVGRRLSQYGDVPHLTFLRMEWFF